jgi:hypothetical protein
MAHILSGELKQPQWCCPMCIDVIVCVCMCVCFVYFYMTIGILLNCWYLCWREGAVTGTDAESEMLPGSSRPSEGYCGQLQ